MAHVHRVVRLVGVRQHLALESLEELRHRASIARKFFVETPRQLLGRARRRDLAFTAARRLEVAGRHACETFSYFERGIRLELGENVFDHPANLVGEPVLLLLLLEESVLSNEVRQLAA